MPEFLAYKQVGERRYREQFGLDFEQFEVGQRFKHRPGLTLSQEDNKNEALETLNQAMLHFDAAYAVQTEWKKNLGVSTLTLQTVIGMTSKTFGKKVRISSFDDIAMTHPVYGGDTLYAESEILGKEEYPESPDLGLLSVLTQGINQKGDVVCKITYKMLVYRAGKDPFDRVNY